MRGRMVCEGMAESLRLFTVWEFLSITIAFLFLNSNTFISFFFLLFISPFSPSLSPPLPLLLFFFLVVLVLVLLVFLFFFLFLFFYFPFLLFSLSVFRFMRKGPYMRVWLICTFWVIKVVNENNQDKLRWRQLWGPIVATGAEQSWLGAMEMCILQ